MSDSAFLELEKGTASPSAGATDFDRFYVDPADNKLTRKKSDGNTEKYISNTNTFTAADIANVPAGDIAATDVQAALNELDTEKLAASNAVSTNTPNTVAKRDGSGDFAMNRLTTDAGMITTVASYTAEFEAQQVRMTDPTSVVRSHLTPGRLDLRDTAGNNGSAEMLAGDLQIAVSGAGNVKFGGKKLKDVGNGVDDYDAINVIQTTYPSTYYVSNSGNDATANGSIGAPYQTIAAAIAAAPAYSTILLMPGGYSEPTVVLPDAIAIKGLSQVNTTVTNGFSHTSTSGASVSITLEFLNYGTLTMNTSACLNGTISFKSCAGFFNYTAAGAATFVYQTESMIYGGTMAAGTASFNECLFVGSLTVSGGFGIFENSKFVQRIEAQGSAIVRFLDCELFSATEFVNGSAGTPTFEVDVATDYLGGYTGTVTKVLMQNIPTATTSVKGLMSAADKTKIDAIELQYLAYQCNTIAQNITIADDYTYLRVDGTFLSDGYTISIEGTGALSLI